MSSLSNLNKRVVTRIVANGLYSPNPRIFFFRCGPKGQLVLRFEKAHLLPVNDVEKVIERHRTQARLLLQGATPSAIPL